MTEFHILRFASGALESILIIIIIRQRVGYLWRFMLLLWTSATAHIIPSLMWSAAWRERIQTPLLTVIFLLATASTFDLFRFLRPRTFPGERRLILAASVAAGLVPVVAGWYWKPETWYQGAMLARQYLWILLLVGTCTAWICIRHLRPVQIPDLCSIHAILWMGWLLAGIPEVCSAKGGLLWMLFPWNGGLTIWRTANDATLTARAVLIVVWAASLLRRKIVYAQEPLDDSPVLAASRVYLQALDRYW